MAFRKSHAAIRIRKCNQIHQSVLNKHMKCRFYLFNQMICSIVRIWLLNTICCFLPWQTDRHCCQWQNGSWLNIDPNRSYHRTRPTTRTNWIQTINQLNSVELVSQSLFSSIKDYLLRKRSHREHLSTVILVADWCGAFRGQLKKKTTKKKIVDKRYSWETLDYRSSIQWISLMIMIISIFWSISPSPSSTKKFLLDTFDPYGLGDFYFAGSSIELSVNFQGNCCEWKQRHWVSLFSKIGDDRNGPSNVLWNSSILYLLCPFGILFQSSFLSASNAPPKRSYGNHWQSKKIVDFTAA